MSTRKPLRKPNLKDLVKEVLDRLPEMSDQQLEDIGNAASQHLFDRDVVKDYYNSHVDSEFQDDDFDSKYFDGESQ